MTTEPEAIGATLRAVRVAQRRHQPEVARAMGTTEATLSAIELGRNEQARRYLADICEALHLRMGEWEILYDILRRAAARRAEAQGEAEDDG